MNTTRTDPKGLMRESYRIAGIGPSECRSIFLDWALSLPLGADMQTVIPEVLAQYQPDNPGHPMNAVLRQGLMDAPLVGRRGGRAARFDDRD